jgi:PncC family amidohydrolase
VTDEPGPAEEIGSADDVPGAQGQGFRVPGSHGPAAARDPERAAQAVVARLAEAGQTLAVAESLTGGLLAARVVDVPGASVAFRGGVVAYATDLKASLLGVDPDLLDRHGAVHAQVAAQMASGVRDRLGATWGLATTGVAGPEPQDGKAPGTVFLGLAGPDGVRTVALALAGGRAQVRGAAVDAALALLLG